MFKFFDPNLEYFAKYDTLCSHIFNYACLKRKAYSYRIVSKLYKKLLYASKTFLKMAGERIHIPHPPPMDPPWPMAISYRNHQKNLAHFSHLAPLVLFVLLKDSIKRRKRGRMSPALNTPLRTGFSQ